MKKSLFFIFFFGIIQSSVAQKENSNWYFGNFAGITFKNGPPVVLTNGLVDDIVTRTSSISDFNGNLKFYTSLAYPIDSTQNYMSDAIGCITDNADRGSLIVPQPGNSNLFFVFNLSSTGYLYYSIIDMSLNGGLGDADLLNCGNLIAQPVAYLSALQVTDSMEITKTWIITHSVDSDLFMAFQLSSSGLLLNPVISKIGSKVGINYDEAQMKFSPDGKKIAYAANVLHAQWAPSYVELFDFDAATGAVSNPRKLNLPYTYWHARGLEFSPSGQYLYNSSGVNDSICLFQWDVTLSNEVQINNSLKRANKARSMVAGQDNGPELCDLQLAQDGKIYFALWMRNRLGVINNPDLPGLLCNYDTTLSLVNGISGSSLPSFVNRLNATSFINEARVNSAFDLYPNPIVDKLYIKNNSLFKSKNLKVLIYDLYGSGIYENYLPGSEGSINLQYLLPGIYFIRLYNDELTFVKKIVKE